jgi:WD40 repeat protein
VEILERKSYKRVDLITCGGPLINNIIFVPKYNVYCLTSNDKHLSFYENVDHTLVRRFSVPDNIFFLTLFGADSLSYRLVGASTNGHIYEFSLAKILSVLDKKNKDALKDEEKKIKEYPPDKQYKYFAVNRVLEEQPDISCLDVMDSLDLLVTGANDSKVRLYEMRESGLNFCKELDGHYKGVKGVSISVHHKLIVSCSFDFDILVWNAYL